jgi:2-C-methyl-D-erythritol 2,4-cyclodiphosphate synthase
MRVGFGFDAHRFGATRALRLGGVEVPHPEGLIAHSDGDVAIHALIDALLGAAALGDIGSHFPDTDPAHKDADSRALLRQVVADLHGRGYQIGNADLTIVCERPKIRPHVAAMRAVLATDLRVAEAAVNVKGTTTEAMGFTGRKEGIAAYAVALLQLA